MAAKKKTSKKTPAKSAKVSKPAKATPKASAKVAASNVDTLAAAGVIEPSELSAAEKTTINGKLTASEVETLISVFGKLGGPTKGRVQVQLCF
jgi:hypothetical protein